MDDQPLGEIAKNKDTMPRASAGAKGTGTAEPRQAAGIAGETIDDARSISRNLGETIDEAATMARNAGEQAWLAASDSGTAAQDLTRRAREQASAASDTLYRQGARAGDYLTRNVNRYPLTAVLIAGAIGYLAARLIHPSLQASDRAKVPAIDR